MTVGSPGHICVIGGVNDKGRPSQPSPLSRWAGPCDGGDDGDGHRLLLWSGKAVMPQAKGVLPGEVPIRGARAQHFATVRPENKVCRVCGSHLAVWASGPKARSGRASAGWCGRRKARTWMRTWVAGLHSTARKRPGRKTQCWRGFSADSLAGLQKSAHEPLRTV